MSDFVHEGWAVYVAVATVVSLIACLVLLFSAARSPVKSDDNTTGHVWDEDLRELNNPLPRWWMWLFVITVLFSAAYLVAYPGLGSFEGKLKWSSQGQLASEMAAAQAELAPVYAPFKNATAQQVAADPSAMAIGQRLFLNQCAQCHGSDGAGSKGFPNLSLPASARLATRSVEDVEAIIRNGRTGVMPPMAAAVGNSEDVRNLAHYVLSLSDSPHNAIAAAHGKSKFGTCAACHGADGGGNPALGAPNLKDQHWLHGWGEQAIVDIVTMGKTNVMPPQANLLTPEQLRVLAVYTWKLSQGAR